MTLIIIIGLLALDLGLIVMLTHQRYYIRKLEAEIEAALYETHTSLHEF